MRSYTVYADRDPEAKVLVDALPNAKGDVSLYRRQMTALGAHLGSAVVAALPPGASEDICVVCTVEDADFLARGLIGCLEARGLGERVRLVCLWNDKIQDGTVSLSPIVRQYEERPHSDRSILVVVKAIISTACVVRTNLTRMISRSAPSKILVVAPVMFAGAESSLAAEFPPAISSQFEFIHFATDSEREGENVVPGIGGSVYQLLGLGDCKEKNRYVPEIVKERRRTRFPIPAMA